MLRIFKRLIGCLIVIGMILIVDRVFAYVLVDDADNEIRYAMQEFYKQEDIDSLFLGSSLVFCGYSPRIMDETWGENTYLAATPVQKIDGGYYLLKEAIKAGAKPVYGIKMLLYQGAESFKIWTGVDAPIDVMEEALKQTLNLE